MTDHFRSWSALSYTAMNNVNITAHSADIPEKNHAWPLGYLPGEIYKF